MSTPRPAEVVITIDTEADNQWETGNPIETRKIAFIPRFQELCDRHGFPPTYLCTYEIVIDDAFDSTLKAWQDEGRAEVAAHLHPWSNPPLENDAYDLVGRPFPSELPDDVFGAKMDVLTRTIAERAGRAPVSFRAGRWGFKAAHIPVLLDLGYTVDCSVTPLTSWARQRGIDGTGPDFRRAPARPYILHTSDVCRAGDSGLLEVPMTIVCRREGAMRLSHRLFPDESSLPARLIRRLFALETEWFRPYPHMTTERMKAVFDLACAAGLPVVTFMFHSSELMPGGSPYNPDEDSIEALYRRFDDLFTWLGERGARGTTLADFAARHAGAS
jgi:hypothetical protein